VRKHLKAVPGGTAGGVISIEAPIHYSNVQLVDPVTGQPSRINVRWTSTGEKVRVAKKSQQIIPIPEEAKRKAVRHTEPGLHDTLPEEVKRVTYFPQKELVPYLSSVKSTLADSSIYRIRVGDEVLPRYFRHVGRKKDRNRLRTKWTKSFLKKTITASEHQMGKQIEKQQQTQELR
jgi:Ribosomal proteins 50S L24/mitochondrial 39S L24